MSNNSDSPIGFLVGFLGMVFVILKLTGHITWSWWWVTAPYWAGIALISVIIPIWEIREMMRFK